MELVLFPSEWIYKYCWVKSSGFFYWPSTYDSSASASPFSSNFSITPRYHLLFLFLSWSNPQNPIQFLFVENVKRHDKAPSSNIRWHSFSNAAHLPTKSSEAGPIVMDWHRWISRLASVKNSRSYLFDVGAGANHQQHYHKNAREVKYCAHRCL